MFNTKLFNSLILVFCFFIINSCNSDDSGLSNELKEGIPGFYKLEKLLEDDIEIDTPNKFLEIKPNGAFYFFEYEDSKCNLNTNKYEIRDNDIVIKKTFDDGSGVEVTTIQYIPVAGFKFELNYGLDKKEYIESYQKIPNRPNVCQLTTDKSLLGKWVIEKETSDDCNENEQYIEFFGNGNMEWVRSEKTTYDDSDVYTCTRSFVGTDWSTINSGNGSKQLVSFQSYGDDYLSNEIHDYKIENNTLTFTYFSSERTDIFTRLIE